MFPFANKALYSQSYGFSSTHVQMWKLDHQESFTDLKNWCIWTAVLEKTLKNLLDNKETKQVNLKGKQPWIFIGRTDAEAKAPILWPPDAKNWLIWKGPGAGNDWRWEEKGMTEDEMVDREWDEMRSLTQWIWVWVNSGNWWWIGKPGVLQHGVTKSWTWLSDWTDTHDFFGKILSSLALLKLDCFFFF